MKLNRETITSGFALLILVFGVYGMLGSRLTPPPPDIPRAVPQWTQAVPRLEPRLHLEDAAGGRDPFKLASDWMPLAAEALAPPPTQPTRWFAIPLGFGPDPLDIGFIPIEAPPPEAAEEDDSKKPSASTDAPPAPPAEPKAAPAPPAAGGGNAGGEGKSAPPDAKSRAGRRRP
jgi:hypothetical protein